MAKVTRTLLKEMVKECLVEILMDGLESPAGEQALVEAVSRTRQQTSSRPDPMVDIQKRRDVLDSKRVDTRRKSAISEAAISNLTQDSTMAEIYADTAATTLASQGLSNSAHDANKYRPADAAATVAYENEPSDLFDGATNWAALAFSD
jgi:uncharacterized protein with LGFP repeats